MATHSDLTDICGEVAKWIKKCLEKPDLDQLVKIVDLDRFKLANNKHKYTAEDLKSVVGTAFSHVAIKFNNEKELQFKNYQNLLNLAILVTKRELCLGILPISLLSDIFDCRTLDECEKLFILVEDNVNVWKEELLFKSVKNQMLRACNDLLKRLSRSQNTVFCGRILVFLARFFPFFERSGLNLISEFNQDNATTFSLQEEGVLSDSMAIDDREIKELDQIQVDYNFYRKFWQLQDFFRGPMICYNRAQFKQLQSYSSDVLQAFSNYKLDPNSYTNFQSLAGLDSDNMYFAKYLTNQKLLELQLSDSNFRRYILIQFLILFQYLTANVRFKQDAQLTEEQTSWVTDTTDRVNKLIEETPPNGTEFRKSVEKILKREEFWSNWKNENCPDLKPTAEKEEDAKKTEANIKATYTTSKRKLGEELKEAEASNRILIGNPELNAIWNLCPDNWEACRSRKRLFTPSVEKFFEKAVKASPKQRQEICSDSDFSWRALRLLSQKSHHFFSPSNQVVKAVNTHLEGVVEKLSKEFPTANHNNSNEFDIDDAEDISDDELLKQVEANTAPNTPNINDNEQMETNEVA